MKSSLLSSTNTLQDSSKMAQETIDRDKETLSELFRQGERLGAVGNKLKDAEQGISFVGQLREIMSNNEVRYKLKLILMII